MFNGVFPAAASVIPPDVSDWLVVYDPAGNIIGEVWCTEEDEAQNPGQAFLITDTTLADPAKLGYATVLVEPGTNQVSDIFGVAWFEENPENYYLAFFDGESFNLQDLIDLNPNIILKPEDSPNGWYDATYYLLPALQAQGYTAAFYSDPEPVPIPTALWLVGAGLLPFLKLRKKRG